MLHVAGISLRAANVLELTPGPHTLASKIAALPEVAAATENRHFSGMAVVGAGGELLFEKYGETQPASRSQRFLTWKFARQTLFVRKLSKDRGPNAREDIAVQINAHSIEAVVCLEVALADVPCSC